MKQTITCKVKLVTSSSDKDKFDEVFEVYKNACNYASKYAYDNKITNARTLQKYVYYDLKTLFDLPAQMACNVCRIVAAKYKTLKSNKDPWTLCKFTKQQLTYSFNRDYSFVKGGLSIKTLKDRIKVNYCSKNLSKYFSIGKKGAANLYEKDGKYYLLISINLDVPDFDKTKTTNVVGVDRGLNFLAVSTDSNDKTNFYSGKRIKEKRNHYKRLRKHLQQIGTSSSRRKLKSIGNRENRFVNDVNHCIAKALVTNAGDNATIVLEDLTNIRKSLKKVKQKDRYGQVSWPYYDLEQKIQYKAILNKSQVIKVPSPYTSQTCPKCGHIDKANRNKHLHLFVCKECGYKSNDDRVASINIREAGKSVILQSR
jgi:IS605 OrfB family transposase